MPINKYGNAINVNISLFSNTYSVWDINDYCNYFCIP